MNRPENKKKHHFFHPVVITINLLLFLILGNVIGVAGAEPQSNTNTTQETPAQPDAVTPSGTKEEVDDAVAVQCMTKMTTFAENEFNQYSIFMENNFKNKSNTSSLLDLGMARYEKFEADIYGKLNVLMNNQLDVAAQAGAGNAAVGTGVAKCQAVADQYVSDAAKMLSMRAISTSNMKKSSIMVEKYKQINEKLRTLNEDIMRMTTGISTFQQKLPCYLKTCIGQ